MSTPVDVRIDRETPVPLYHQLAEQLSAAIARGDLQPGDAFENEVAMAERLGLSRPTRSSSHKACSCDVGVSAPASQGGRSIARRS